MQILKTGAILTAVIGLFTISSCSKEEPINEASSCFSISNTNINVGQTVSFSNCSSYGTNYNWDFGDGTSSTLVDPKHVYTSDGTFTVTLTSKNSEGVGNSTSKQINVTARVPVNMIINKIVLNKWPASNNGVSWDNNSYPDIYPFIDQGSNTVYESSYYYSDCSPNKSYTYGSDSGLPITITNLNEIVGFGFYDYDDFSLDDYMGGVQFTAISHFDNGTSKIVIAYGDWVFDVHVSWTY